MINVAALEKIRDERCFTAWDGSVGETQVASSEEAIDSLVDTLLELGPIAPESAVRRAVHDCVERFNKLNDGWICTAEGETICACLEKVVLHCGLKTVPDWVGENCDW